MQTNVNYKSIEPPWYRMKWCLTDKNIFIGTSVITEAISGIFKPVFGYQKINLSDLLIVIHVMHHFILNWGCLPSPDYFNLNILTSFLIE